LNAFVRGVTAGATGVIAGAVAVLARRSVYDLPTILICLLSLGIYCFAGEYPSRFSSRVLPRPVEFYIIMREKPRSR
jgi:hypothetical protein